MTSVNYQTTGFILPGNKQKAEAHDIFCNSKTGLQIALSQSVK